MRSRPCVVCACAPCRYRPRVRPLRRNPSEARSLAARRGWEHRKESDEAVEVNLDPHELALWDRTKSRFKGSPEERLRAFRDYVHDHPDEIYDSLERQSETRLKGLLKAHAAKVRVSVLCEPPYRVRTKELCAMQANPRKRRRRKNLFGESSAQRSRRLSDERARKRLEAPSRRTRRGDKTRGDKVKYARKRKNISRAKRAAERRVSKTIRQERRAGKPRNVAAAIAYRKERAYEKKRGKRVLNGRRRRRNAPYDPAVAMYKRLHWGIDPKDLRPKQMFAATLKPPFAVMGDLVAIVYRTRKDGEGCRDKACEYEHEFGPGTKLVVNGQGELLIAKTSRSGGYHVTDRGIVG